MSTYRLEALDVLSAQCAWGGVRVTRNENLLADRPTNPAFVYAVERRMEHPAVPCLERTAAIDVAGITGRGPPHLSLLDHVIGFFGALLDVAGPPPRGYPRVGVSVAYTIPISAGFDLLDREALRSYLPVALVPVPDRAFDPARDLGRESGLCHDLAAAMAKWFADRTPSTRGAAWSFQISLYASGAAGSTAGRPLLTLSDARLSLGDVHPAAQ